MVSVRALLGAALAGAAAAMPAGSAPTPNPTPHHHPSTMNVRIIGDGNTILFDGGLQNPGGNVTTETTSGGTHTCGYATNGGALPGGAPVGALDMAAKRKGFSWDGTWDGDNYAVTAISSYSAAGPDDTWAFYYDENWADPAPPTCDTSLNWGGNQLWWIFNPAQYQHFLHLHPIGHNPVQGQPFAVTVTDYLTGAPVQGATVRGQTTDANGQATIELADCIPYFIHAEMAGSLRSNTVYIVANPDKRKRCV